jgi:hypothetical protein
MKFRSAPEPDGHSLCVSLIASGEIGELADRIVQVLQRMVGIQNRPFQWKDALHEMLGDEKCYRDGQNRTRREEEAMKLGAGFPWGRPWDGDTGGE